MYIELFFFKNFAFENVIVDIKYNLLFKHLKCPRIIFLNFNKITKIVFLRLNI